MVIEVTAGKERRPMVRHGLGNECHYLISAARWEVPRQYSEGLFSVPEVSHDRVSGGDDLMVSDFDRGRNDDRNTASSSFGL